MQNIRRWYVYLTCAISLNAVLWAVIALLRNLVTPSIGSGLDTAALQIAILLIGVPVFGIHWVWAQRAAASDREERSAVLRRLYLFAILAALLTPMLVNLYSWLLNLLDPSAISNNVLFYLIPVLVMGVMFAYHQRVLAEDVETAAHAGDLATVRRVYVLAFSTAGLWMSVLAMVNLLRRLLLIAAPASGSVVVLQNRIDTEIVRLIIGTGMWVYFWRWAQSLFYSRSQEEKQSTLRKIYLYFIVFASSLVAVSAATVVLAGLFRRFLDLPSLGDGGSALALIVGASVTWAFHAYVLRQDADAVKDVPRQAAVRRIYLYLVAAIGLGAFLVGLAGDVSVLLGLLAERVGFLEGSRSSFAWFTAALVAGLPVWLLPWRGLEADAASEGQRSAEHRRATPRKIYLYLFLFAASMTVLASLISIVYQFLLLLFGERGTAGLFFDITQPLAYAALAAGVLVYHGGILRRDGEFERAEREKRIAKLRVVVLEAAKGGVGKSLKQAIAAEFPTLQVDLLPGSGRSSSAGLKNASLIIAPWNALVGRQVPAGLSMALAASTAQKLLIPFYEAKWAWVGVDEMSPARLQEEALEAVKRLLAGDLVQAGTRRMGCLAWVGIVLGIMFLLFAVPLFYGLATGF
jgi:hypothetical protein